MAVAAQAVVTGTSALAGMGRHWDGWWWRQFSVSELAYSAALSSSSISVSIVVLSESYVGWTAAKLNTNFCNLHIFRAGGWTWFSFLWLTHLHIIAVLWANTTQNAALFYLLYIVRRLRFLYHCPEVCSWAEAEPGSQGRCLGQENFLYYISTLADDVIQFQKLYKKLNASSHFPTIFKFHANRSYGLWDRKALRVPLFFNDITEMLHLVNKKCNPL